MNKLYIGLALLGVSLTACDEKIPESFREINGVYFNNRLSNRTLADSTSLTFVYENADTLNVPVVVQLLGRPSAGVRPVDIRISSEDAVEGVDYVLKTPAEFPADSAVFNYIVMLKRTPVLKQQSKSILLELKGNDYFSLPVAFEVQAGGDTTSVLSYRIIYSDLFTAPPVGWQEDLGGEFSQQKFELICRVLGIAPADFNEKGKISLARWFYINGEMVAYVEEQVTKKNAGEEYDTDAFDKQTGVPLKF